MIDNTRAGIVRKMVPDRSTWPAGDRLCMKRITSDNRADEFGTIRSDQAPFTIFSYRGHPLGTFETVEAMIAAGWAVD